MADALHFSGDEGPEVFFGDDDLLGGDDTERGQGLSVVGCERLNWRSTVPFVAAQGKCPRQGSNLHSLYGNQALNLARLPIPPLGLCVLPSISLTE